MNKTESEKWTDYVIYKSNVKKAASVGTPHREMPDDRALPESLPAAMGKVAGKPPRGLPQIAKRKTAKY